MTDHLVIRPDARSERADGRAPAASAAPVDEEALEILLCAIEELRDPAHAMDGLVALAAEQAKGTHFAGLCADVEREVCRTMHAIESVLHASAVYRNDKPRRRAQSNLRILSDVLIVDDNSVNQALTAAQLRQLGHRADQAMSGEEALDYLTAHEPSMILMDWHLGGIDGLETCRRIRRLEQREERKRVPIIALTAQVMPGDRERCLAVGMDGFLAKPLGLDDLRAEVDRWLAGC